MPKADLSVFPPQRHLKASAILSWLGDYLSPEKAALVLEIGSASILNGAEKCRWIQCDGPDPREMRAANRFQGLVEDLADKAEAEIRGQMRNRKVCAKLLVGAIGALCVDENCGYAIVDFNPILETKARKSGRGMRIALQMRTHDASCWDGRGRPG